MMRQFTLEQAVAILVELVKEPFAWGLLTLVLVITLAFVALLMRDRKQGLGGRSHVWILGPLGALVAILWLQSMTSSEFSDIGGPIDWILLLLIGGLGAFLLTILVYVTRAIYSMVRD